MLAASKVKVSGSEKESKNIESFTFVVVEQQRQRNVQKSVFTCKVVFLLIRPIVVGVVVVFVCFFFCRSQCRRRLALHDFVSKLHV